MRKLFAGIGLICALSVFGAAVYFYTPPLRTFDRQAALDKAKVYQARIVRDAYGVPHIYGVRNVDVVFSQL